MEHDYLYEFLLSIPFWLLCLAIFLMTFLVDVFYVLWIRRSVEGKAMSAAFYSALLSFFGTLSFYSIIKINSILFPIALLGYFLGTYYTIKYEIRTDK